MQLIVRDTLSDIHKLVILFEWASSYYGNKNSQRMRHRFLLQTYGVCTKKIYNFTTSVAYESQHEL